jgi:radical SAM protein with 4Fe4S-binding SPASM domain
MNLTQTWKRIFNGEEPGRKASVATDIMLYHYVRQEQGEKTRLHLRIDSDGSGILLVNASRVMHLNASAASMARLALDKTPPAQAARMLQRQFSISTKKAIDDYTEFCDQFEGLISTQDLCPIHDLDVETIPPFSSQPSAPYRMDLALTYRCNNDCAHCYNARPRQFPELQTEVWKQLIQQIWNIGIPHIVFTGGEPTLRSDLPELVAFAESTGLITGLNTNGRRLQDKRFVDELVSAGLDHVQITLESHNPDIHNRMVRSNNAWEQTVRGIRNVLDSPLFVMTNTTMLKQNAPFLDQTLDFLAGIGVPTIGLNALIHAGMGATCGSGLEEAELAPLLETARIKTEYHQQRLIWYTPTQYCNFDPMELELGVKGCTAALYNMCIEPDGAVIPCQSYYQPLGSLLGDQWNQIWNHELALDLRNRHYAAEKCNGCVLFSECGGGCPLTQ